MFFEVIKIKVRMKKKHARSVKRKIYGHKDYDFFSFASKEN